MSRFRVVPPEGIARKSWQLRSSYILGEHADEHDATLEALGLERALERAEVGPFLVERKKALQELHSIKDAGLVVVPYGAGGLVPMPAVEPFPSLVERAESIARRLDCEPGPVVSFLLTGKAFTLPWIEIEDRLTKLGLSFVIHIGSADVTAEEVRQAYVAASCAALGVEGSRALPAHIVPLILKDAEGRRAGLTWEKRWKEWQRYAREWSITGYKTVESYRNYINKKRAQHEWIRLELEQADAERLSKSTEEDE